MTHPTAKCTWCQSLLVKLDKTWWCPQASCRTIQREYAIGFQVPKIEKGKFAGYEWQHWWVPLPLQAEFLRIRAKRKLLGGAAGGSKSTVSRFGAHRLCLSIPGLSVLLLRKTYPELERTHIRKLRAEAQELGFQWMEQAKEARYKNGSVLECGHMDDEASLQKFLSSEYDLIIFEEAVQNDPDRLMELMSRARTSNETVRELGGPWVWLPTNPGGPAHALLRDLFISRTPDTERYPAIMRGYREEDWVHVRATLDDNPYIDPDYETIALGGLRKARYEQLRNGDWDAAEGMFFEDFARRTHARKVHIPRPVAGAIEAVDWGFSSFGCVGWFAPVGDNHWHCIMEWKFRKLVAEDVAKGIVKVRKELGIKKVAYTVVDPSMFNKTGHGKGESYAETFARFKVPCRRGDNDRVMGWGRLAAWFKFDPATATEFNEQGEPLDGVPWLTFDPDTCKYLLRSIPALLCDKSDPEDIDTSLDDHGADMVRYFTQSRPSVSKPPSTPQTPPAVFSPAWLKSLVVREEAGVLA